MFEGGGSGFSGSLDHMGHWTIRHSMSMSEDVEAASSLLLLIACCTEFGGTIDPSVHTLRCPRGRHAVLMSRREKQAMRCTIPSLLPTVLASTTSTSSYVVVPRSCYVSSNSGTLHIPTRENSCGTVLVFHVLH